jgi:hypothetical protein
MTDPVRTVLSFNGSNAAADKIFAATRVGIFDCTTSTASPALVVAFSVTTGSAGFGTATAYTTPGGRFLIYCDEENGMYVYSQTAGWTLVPVSSTTQAWQGSTGYSNSPQNFVVNGTRIYKCVGSGVSAASGGPTGTGAAIVDGTAQWDYVSAVLPNAIGPSLNDQNLGFSANPSGFAFVAVWKSRLWFVEKNSSRGWYMPVGSLFGTASSFDFGVKMLAGGDLRGLFNWSYDAGGGLDTMLVGLSGGGDVVIYQGTDPSSAATFSLKGTWSVGGVPAGRRLAVDFGGDLLVASSLGIVPLSKLVTGQPVVAGDRSVYATGKVSNLFSMLVAQQRAQLGWALVIHPTDNALLVLTPVGTGQPTTQLAMSIATRGWFQYRDLPMLSAGRWNGQLYFGTLDGRLCVNAGYVDDVKLGGPNISTPVAWSILTAYSTLGSTKNKRLKQIRTTTQSQVPTVLLQTTAKYDYDTTEPPPPAGANSSASGSTWDTAIWDSSTWAGDYVNLSQLQGAIGVGRAVAVACRGTAISRTILTQFDLYFDTAEGADV